MLNLPKLERCVCDGIDYFTDDALFEVTGVRIAFLGRTGGVSRGEFSSLNVGCHVDDNLQDVNKNREILLDTLSEGDADVSIYSPRQVHGDEIIEITSEQVPEEIDADGVICKTENVCPLLSFADCCPVILVAENGIFAVVHAGWRGVVNRISAKSLKLMSDKYHCDAATINAYVGPHLRQCCFEVGADVANIFTHEFGSEVIDNNHVSMLEALKNQLLEAGLQKTRFCDLGMCTKCYDDLFFSYRASGGRCGRHAALAFKEVKKC